MKIQSFRGKYAFLSNFYECPITVHGVTFNTVEHAFQAFKMTNAEDAEAIRICPTPGTAKRSARKRKLRTDWEQIKEEVMLLCLREKFKQPFLKEMLINTGEAELIEVNTWGDTYWGVFGGRGLNRLGCLLMQVREELRNA